jgi:hypothetical protein
MPHKTFFQLCAVMLLTLAAHAPAEDAAPPAPAAPAAADADKKEPKAESPDKVPAAPAADAAGDKKDAQAEAPKAADKSGKTAADTNPDPSAVVGPKPTYPLKSDTFADIVEDYSNDDDLAANQEPSVMDVIFRAVRATSHDDLKKFVNPQVTYVTMMNNPETCHGEVVKVSGTFRAIAEKEQNPPIAGITKYWKGQISVGAGKISTFISLEPLPKDVQIGRGINVVGVFWKRFVYPNNTPGEKGTICPLIVVRHVERVTDYENVAPGAMNSPIGIGIFVFVGAGFLLYLYSRTASKARYANKFSRMKDERSNTGGRNFPRAG